MFLLPLILLPFIFMMAVNRSIRIPLALRRGELHVLVRRRRSLAVAAAAGYLLLLIYTAVLSVAILQAALLEPDAAVAWLALAGYIAAYPLVYMAVAWVFYHALKKALAA